MESLKTSSVAAQIDPNILPNIHFQPVSQGKRRSWLKSVANNLYWDLFEKIAKFRSTRSHELPSHLRQSFQKLPFHEQLTMFQLSQQLTEDQRRIRWQIAVDILSAIRDRPEYRNCDAIVYGSLVTGMSNPASDIDIFIDIDGDNGQALETKSTEEKRNTYSDFVRSLQTVLKNAASPHDPAQKLFSTVHLRGGPSKFFRLQEGKTGIMIDLEVNEKLGIRDTKLLQFYNNFEPKTKQLFIFLSYWAKFHQVCGTNKLRKWSMRILILVFLMEKNIIPSVLLLQAIAAFQRSEPGQGSHPNTRNSYICEDSEATCKYFSPAVVTGPINTPEEETKAFLDLLIDFFRMVVKTKFSVCLVSPQLGRIVRKGDVAKEVSSCVKALPTELRDCWQKLNPNYFGVLYQFFHDVAVFIQDPFEIDQNTAKLCSEKSLDEFVSAAKYTLSILVNRPSSLFQLFARGPTVVKRKFSAVAQRSEDDEYINALLNTKLKPDPEGESPTIEILQAVRDISEVPDGLFKNPENFDAIHLDRSKYFLDSYMAKLYKWNMLGSSEDVSSWQIQLRVTALWDMLAKQYLEDFFTKGLFLPKGAVTMKRVDVISPISSADMWTYDDAYTQKKIAYFERTKVKKVWYVSKPRDRTGELSIPVTTIKYGVIKVKVTYPFWKRKYYTRISDLDGEADVSEESYKEHLSKRNEIAKGASRQGSDFTPFFIYGLYKLDTRIDEINQLCSDPTITFAVQEFIEGNIPQQGRLERMLARKCVMEIFQRTFETHLLHKLAKRLKG